MAAEPISNSRGVRDRAQFDEVTVGVVQEKLDGSVGTLLRGRDEGDAESLDPASRFMRVLDQEREVMPARVGSAAKARRSRAFKLKDRVNQGRSRLKPLPGEAEVRPGDLIHAESFDIEPPRRGEVFDDDGDVVERLDADGSGFGHEVIVPVATICFAVVSEGKRLACSLSNGNDGQARRLPYVYKSAAIPPLPNRQPTTARRREGLGGRGCRVRRGCGPLR